MTNLTIQQIADAKKEIRVYVWEANGQLHPNTSTDEAIMSHCEQIGG